jgi:hypothetical protein
MRSARSRHPARQYRRSRRVARVERQASRQGCRGNQSVACPRSALPASARSDATTRPNARAAAASKGNGSKSASACYTCACRAARSSSLDATNGPTLSSASVIAVISGSAGSTSSDTRDNRISVLVSSTPAAGGASLTTTHPAKHRCPASAAPDPRTAAASSAGSARLRATDAVAADAVPRPASHHALQSAPHPALRGPEPRRHDCAAHES